MAWDLIGFPSGPLPVLYTFSTKIQATMQPNCQCKWSASLPVIINKFSFVFDCCFTAIDICRLPWPWDVRLLKRRQYREDLGNSPSWRPKLPVFPLFPCSPAPFEPSFCPQSLLGSIHLFCWALCINILTKSSSKLVRWTVTSVSELEKIGGSFFSAFWPCFYYVTLYLVVK